MDEEKSDDSSSTPDTSDNQASSEEEYDEEQENSNNRSIDLSEGELEPDSLSHTVKNENNQCLLIRKDSVEKPVSRVFSDDESFFKLKQGSESIHSQVEPRRKSESNFKATNDLSLEETKFVIPINCKHKRVDSQLSFFN